MHHHSYPILGMLPLVLFWLTLFLTNWLLLRRHFVSILDGIIISCFLSWTAVIIVSYFLSLLGLLGYSAILFCSASWLATIGASTILRLLKPNRAITNESPATPSILIAPYIAMGFVAVIGYLFICNLLIALSYEPNNNDTISYRYPRPYFYFANGSFTHFSEGVDPRLIYYPLNGVILNLPAVVLGQPVQSLTLPSVVAWLVVVLIIIQFCKELGFSYSTSVISAGLIATSPDFLAQATSGNDEILAVAPLLAGIRFLALYFRNYSFFDALMCGLCLGCGLGTKLHWIMYWPMGLVAIILFYYHFRFRFSHIIFIKKNLVSLALPLALAFLLSTPFIYYNIKATGSAFNNSLADQVLNKPFSFGVALTNLELQTLQLLVNPIVDVNVFEDDTNRNMWVQHVNKVSMKIVPKYVDLTVPYENFDPFYGLESQLGYLPYEQSVWLGFLPYAFVLIVGILIFRPIGFSTFILQALACSAIVWWLTFCISSKFYYTVGIYAVIPAVLASPVLAIISVREVYLPRVWGVIKSIVLLVLTATNLTLDYGLINYNLFRPLSPVWRHPFVEISSPSDPGVKTRMQAAKVVLIPDLHWETPILNIIAQNVSARYFICGGTITPTPTEMTFLTVQGDPQFGWIDFESTEGLSDYLGTVNSGYGKEGVFELLKQSDGRRHFLILANYGSLSGSTWTIKPGPCYGDKITRLYSLIVKSSDGAIIARMPSFEGSCSIDLSKLRDKSITVDLLDKSSGKVIGDASFDPSNNGGQLDFVGRSESSAK